jgi:hypothetical protein
MKKKFLLLLFLILSLMCCLANDSDSLLYTNHIFSDRIKTVQLYREGWNLSYPVMKLRSSDKLILQFDLLGSAAFKCACKTRQVEIINK